MPKLIIQRSHEYMNRRRKINVFIDGIKVGTIANNTTVEYEITEGTHTVKARIDWCGSRDLELSVKEGETKYLKLSGIPYANPVLLIWGVLFLLNFYMTVSLGKNYSLYISVPFGLAVLYYFTLGRNDYLRLKEHDFFQ